MLRSRPGLMIMWLVLLSLAAPAPALVVADSSTAGEDPLRVLSADVTGLSLELETPPHSSTPMAGPDGRSYTRVVVPGFAAAGAPGQPELPMHAVLLAVPPAAQWTVETEILAETSVTLAAAVWPAPAHLAEIVDDAAARAADSTSVPLVTTRFVVDDAAYTSDTFVPHQLAGLQEAGILRDVRIARLVIAPVRYLAATQELRIVQRARITIRFVDGASLPAVAASRPDPGGFGDLVRQAVINPGQVEAWRFAEAPGLAAAGAIQSAPAAPGQPRYRITVREEGIYRLTYDALLAAGVGVGELDPRRLRVFWGADELAIEVTGEADGRFDPVDEIRFYAERVRSLYTDINNYWLVLGAENGRRMTQRSVAPQNTQPSSSFPATQRFEENRIYRSNLPAESGVDHWFWGQMYVIGASRVPTLTLPFTIEHPLPAGQAVLMPELWGASSDASIAPDHRVEVRLNGAGIGVVEWDGMGPARPQLVFDQALLHAGDNLLTFYTPGDTGARDSLNRLWESNWLNWYSLTYQKAFRASENRLDFTPLPGPTEFLLEGWSEPGVFLYDVTNAHSPARLVGALPGGAAGDATLRFADQAPANSRYHATALSAMRTPETLSSAPSADLWNPTQGADYLLIVHADFLAGVEPLVQLRRDQGLRVRVIDVQTIYDEFSAGLLDPWAIRDFIRHAYLHWPGPPPAYVVLVGDGTYDFMNNEGYGAKTFIPPLLAYVDPILGETAADNRFVTVVGEDVMPDLHLGRLPVNNQTELAAMVGKITAYERNPTPGPWRTKAVFVADNPDVAGPFGVLSDAAAALVPPEFEITKIYLGTAQYPTNQALRAQQATLDAFNQGAIFFNYVGHSSISNWAAELLFGTNALPQVRNGSYYPIVLPMTCLEGSYHNPRFAGVSESLVRLSNGGALASWGPTGLGVASGHDYLHTGFYKAIFEDGGRELGPATTAAKLNLFTNARFPNGAPRFHDLMDTYVLLGDPATRIGLPEADLHIEAAGPDGHPLAPDDAATFTVRYRNDGAARVKGVVVSADLPGALTDLAWQSDDSGLAPRPGASLAWDVAEMAPGSSGTITITSRIPTAIDPGALPLRAEMHIISRWHESNLANNTAGPLEINLLPADLLLVQVAEPVGQVAPGEWLTFTLSYANLGPGSASGVTLLLPLPVALEDVRITELGPAAALQPGAHYHWELGTVSAGGKGRLTLAGRLPHNLPEDKLIWSVAARIAATWPDSDPSNNVARAALIQVDVGDPFEPDNTRETARRLSVPALDQPRSYDPVGDQDWVLFRAQAGVRYVIRTVDLGTGGDTVLFLWDEAGRLVAKNDDAGPHTRFSAIYWTADADQDYYAMVTSTSSAAGFSYGIELLALPQNVFLPILSHGGVR